MQYQVFIEWTFEGGPNDNLIQQAPTGTKPVTNQVCMMVHVRGGRLIRQVEWYRDNKTNYYRLKQICLRRFFVSTTSQSKCEAFCQTSHKQRACSHAELLMTKAGEGAKQLYLATVHHRVTKLRDDQL